jgi:hypothetical protein
MGLWRAPEGLGLGLGQAPEGLDGPLEGSEGLGWAFDGPLRALDGPP